MKPKKKPTKASRPKTEINGKLPEPQESTLKVVTKPHRSIAEILGQKHSNYTTTDLELYRKQLEKLNKIDLQKECLRVGLHPKDDRNRMTESLCKMFRDYHMSLDTSNLKVITLQPSDKSKRLLGGMGGGY